jgi:hypothetical protein
MHMNTVCRDEEECRACSPVNLLPSAVAIEDEYTITRPIASNTSVIHTTA